MSFENCDAAYDAGRSNIPQGDPDYAKKLDRDNDGIACDNPPAGFKPAPATNTGTKTETGAGTGDNLPRTGSGMEAGVAGGGLLVLGLIAAVVLRRRRTRFVA